MADSIFQVGVKYEIDKPYDGGGVETYHGWTVLAVEGPLVSFDTGNGAIEIINTHSPLFAGARPTAKKAEFLQRNSQDV